MIFRKHLINSSRNALIIFTREPEPGRTKTRLMPYFSAEKCASLHCCMLRDIRREMKHADADIVVAYTGSQQGPLFLRKMKPTIRGYCPVCGKLGDIKDKSRWYQDVPKTLGGYLIYDTILTEEGEREMNPRTRTLPYFEVVDPFVKFAEVKE
jgi:hypothetical protein